MTLAGLAEQVMTGTADSAGLLPAVPASENATAFISNPVRADMRAQSCL
jgi:hypothetical protein